MSDKCKECGCNWREAKWWAIMWMVIIFSLATCTAVTEVAKEGGFRSEAEETP